MHSTIIMYLRRILSLHRDTASIDFIASPCIGSISIRTPALSSARYTQYSDFISCSMISNPFGVGPCDASCVLKLKYSPFASTFAELIRGQFG